VTNDETDELTVEELVRAFFDRLLCELLRNEDDE
jgi:hypothetical protein